MDPVDVALELEVDGVWTAVPNDDLLVRDEITGSRGRSDWSGEIDASDYGLLLRNPGGRYTPGNPTSPHYPHLARNTPARLSVSWDGVSHYRIHGAVAEWPLNSDLSGADRTIPVAVSGPLRRVRGRSKPLRSPIYRHIVRSASNLVQYWPCEEAKVSRRRVTRFPSAVDGQPPMVVSEAAPQPGNDDIFPCSAPLPTLDGDQWTGDVDGFATGTVADLELTAVRWLMHIVPSSGGTGVPVGQTIIEVHTPSRIWRVLSYTGNTLELRQISAESGNQLDTATGLFAAGLLDVPCVMSLELDYPNSWALRLVRLDADPDANHTGFGPGFGPPVIERVVVSPFGGIPFGSSGTVTVGHVHVQREATALNSDVAGWHDALGAWAGEPAAVRAGRISAEESLSLQITGDAASSLPMGPQPIATLADILQSCADTDSGILYEPPDEPGVGLRTGGSLSGQPVAVELDYAAGDLSPPFDPTVDTALVANDVTVTSDSGATDRSVDSSGPVGVARVGRVERSADVNPAADELLQSIAHWLRHLGTVDQVRVPALTVGLHRGRFATTPWLRQAVLGLRVGDVVSLVNLPDDLPVSTLDLMVQGYSERVGAVEHWVEFNVTAAEPWHVGRFDTMASELVNAVSDAATAWNVKTALGPRWTADVSVLDLDAAATNDYATTPDHASLDVTGDLDIRVLLRMNSWTPAAIQSFVGKFDGAINQRSYLFRILTTGVLQLLWSPDGTTTNTAAATVAVPPNLDTVDPVWIRATLDVNNGAAGRNINFYWSYDGVDWTPIGATVTQAGVTSIFSSTVGLAVGAANPSGTDPLSADVYAAEARSGIGGTSVANPDFSRQVPGATSFTDDAGRVWTVQANAAVAASETFDGPFVWLVDGERVTVDLVRGVLAAKQAATVTRGLDAASHLAGADVALADAAYFGV